jgi:integrase
LSEKKATTHTLIENQLTIAKREESKVWQCRLKIGGVWQRISTGERDLRKAKKRAHELLIEANVRVRLNHTPVTRRFTDVAKLAIKRMDDEIAAGAGKAIYEDYKFIINRYCIPDLGSYLVDNIDYAVLEQFEQKRNAKMGRVPTKSTVLNHNAALNRVFDEAVLRGFLLESTRPKLLVKGRKSEKRPSFSLEETRALLANFDEWIERGRADTIPIRALLKNYVQMLLDTGARPGDELLTLKWGQIEFRPDPKFIHTGKDELGDDEYEIEYNVAYVIKIQNSKTHARSAIGKRLTGRALRAIAKRNYDMALMDTFKKKKKDLVFVYREWLNDEDVKEGKKARLVAPTSFNRLFHSYLKEHNLLIDPVTGKERPFYSLRHTYATQALINNTYPIHTLAKQMGNSVKMIEEHYSDLTPERAIDTLRNDHLLNLIESRPVIDDAYKFDETKSKKQRKSRKKSN